MKTRVITAVLAALMLLIIILLGKEVYGLFITVLALIAINELYGAFENLGIKAIRFFSIVFVIPLAVSSFADRLYIKNFIAGEKFLLFITAYAYLVFIFIFLSVILNHKKYNISDATLTFTAGLMVTFFFSFLVAVIYLGETTSEGFHYLVLLLLGAWGTDTFAYFGGNLFGKHKLAPEVSPKKTIEGSIAGTLGSMLLVTLYGYFALGFKSPKHVLLLIILGFMTGIISQIGDLIASCIKRHCGIKDYGNIMPGHGGILDRFDSVLMIAPFVYYYITFFMEM